MASDTLYLSLPRAIQRKIDFAFDNISGRIGKPSETSAPGGFIPESGGFLRDEQDDDLPAGFFHEEGGGFMKNDHGQGSIPSYIPLSMIPAALQLLDLPSDDEEVLSVFRNAATGWSSSDNTLEPHGPETGEHISRDDWRSIVAVLLEHTTSGDANMDGDVDIAGSGRESDNASDTDEYHESEPDEEEREGDDDDDDYTEGLSSSLNRRRTRRTRKSSASLSPPLSATSPDFRSRKLTPQQRQVCIDAYILFFPSSPPDKLLDQRIMLKDVQRVARLLNEKLKTEEMFEMLETFSTSPDKSMNFDDFCNMMIRAKLA